MQLLWNFVLTSNSYKKNDQNFSFFFLFCIKEMREQRVIDICTICPAGERNEINAYGAC